MCDHPQRHVQNFVIFPNQHCVPIKHAPPPAPGTTTYFLWLWAGLLSVPAGPIPLSVASSRFLPTGAWGAISSPFTVQIVPLGERGQSEKAAP